MRPFKPELILVKADRFPAAWVIHCSCGSYYQCTEKCHGCGLHPDREVLRKRDFLNNLVYI